MVSGKVNKGLWSTLCGAEARASCLLMYPELKLGAIGFHELKT